MSVLYNQEMSKEVYVKINYRNEEKCNFCNKTIRSKDMFKYNTYKNDEKQVFCCMKCNKDFLGEMYMKYRNLYFIDKDNNNLECNAREFYDYYM
jgi:ribosomal protein L37AE/L43A